MIGKSMLDRIAAKLRNFSRDTGGNLSVLLALGLVPVVGGIGAAVDYSQANSVKAAMQAAADATALAMIRTASTQSASQLQSAAQQYFTATFNRPNATPAVSASYDAANVKVTIGASSTVNTNFMKIAGVSQMAVSVTAKATIGGSQTWPVCVLITDPSSNHTELVMSTSTIDFFNCVNQVNTQNWDAVEARDTSYIHTTNGVNCFTGDIHYGDVQPPKQPTCTMLPDPFQSFVTPAAANTCTYTQMKVQTENTVLTPGTYCKGLQIQNVSLVTFSPGLYIIKDGNLQIKGQGNSNMTVTAPGVTFLLTGNSAGLDLQNATLNMSPDMGSDAGQYAGFLFFLDQTPGSNGKTQYDNNTQWNSVVLNGSGIVYLAGMNINLQKNSQVTLNTGTFIAGLLNASSSQFLLYGTTNYPSAAAAAMKKSIASNTPILVQ